MNVLPDVYICSLRKKNPPFLPERTVKLIAAIHLLFKIVINLKILENSQEYVNSEVIFL